MKLPRLIGIAGKAGAGKDTLADQLVRQHGFVKYSLAAPMKKMLNDLFGWTDENWQDRKWKERKSVLFNMRNIGRSIDVDSLSPRQLAQWLGTEVGRTIGGPDVWLNLMVREWNSLRYNLDYHHGEGVSEPCARMVVADVRFDNEARRIRDLGGVIIRINRPGVAGVAQHASEKGVSDELVNVEVTNDTDIITFLRNCHYALEDCPRGV